MSQVEVDKIIPQSGTTLTIGDSGDTIAIASGATVSGSISGITNLTITGDLTVDTNTLYVDSTNNIVGIGKSNPAYNLDIEGQTGSLTRLRVQNAGTIASDSSIVQIGIAGTTAESLIYFADSADNNVGMLRYDHASDYLSTHTNGSEAMRIDSSGNLLVGTTSVGFSDTGAELRATGQASLTVDGNACAYMNRLTSDGRILEFSKDGTVVGSIGVNGDRIYLINANEGIAIDDSLNEIFPCNNFGNTLDDTISLGGNGRRFKDIYLSGGAYLGGTGTANKLDDYEEGEWTPQVQDSSSNNASMGSSSQNFGDYVRVGKMVFVTARVQVASNSGLTGSNRANISGLPFTGINQRSTGAVNFTDFSLPAGASDIYLYFEPTTDKFQMYVRRTGNTSADFTVSELGTTSSSFGFSATYIIG